MSCNFFPIFFIHIYLFFPLRSTNSKKTTKRKFGNDTLRHRTPALPCGVSRLMKNISHTCVSPGQIFSFSLDIHRRAVRPTAIEQAGCHRRAWRGGPSGREATADERERRRMWTSEGRSPPTTTQQREHRQNAARSLPSSSLRRRLSPTGVRGGARGLAREGRRR